MSASPQVRGPGSDSRRVPRCRLLAAVSLPSCPDAVPDSHTGVTSRLDWGAGGHSPLSPLTWSLLSGGPAPPAHGQAHPFVGGP